MVDLGYLKVPLKQRWLARAELDGQELCTSLVFIREDAKAEIFLISAGQSNDKDALEQVYLNIMNNYKARAFHFDDLSDECDYEFSGEIQAIEGVVFEHIFLRQVENVILLAKLRNYFPEDEQELRQMLDHIEPGAVKHQTPFFDRIEISLNLSDWNQMGNVALRSGEM